MPTPRKLVANDSEVSLAVTAILPTQSPTNAKNGGFARKIRLKPNTLIRPLELNPDFSPDRTRS